MENTITEIIARRQFMPLYIWLDIGFLVLLASAGTDLRCGPGSHRDPAHHRGLSWLYGPAAVYRLSDPDCLQSPAAGRSPAHPHSLAVGHGHSGAVWLGGRTSHRRHPQRRLLVHGAEAVHAGGQLPAGDQPWDALHLSAVHRLLPPLYRAAETPIPGCGIYGAYPGKQPEAIAVR